MEQLHSIGRHCRRNEANISTGISRWSYGSIVRNEEFARPWWIIGVVVTRRFVGIGPRCSSTLAPVSRAEQKKLERSAGPRRSVFSFLGWKSRGRASRSGGSFHLPSHMFSTRDFGIEATRARFNSCPSRGRHARVIGQPRNSPHFLGLAGYSITVPRSTIRAPSVRLAFFSFFTQPCFPLDEYELPYFTDVVLSYTQLRICFGVKNKNNLEVALTFKK